MKKMTPEQFEQGISQGAKILSRWANCEGINVADATKELLDAGYGHALLDQAFEVAIAAEGYEYLIKDGLRKMLADWNPEGKGAVA